MKHSLRGRGQDKKNRHMEQNRNHVSGDGVKRIKREMTTQAQDYFRVSMESLSLLGLVTSRIKVLTGTGNRYM